jgi:hypothetical protein
MKKVIIAILTLALGICLAATTSLDGAWTGQGGKQDKKYGSVPTTATMTLTQAGSKLTGTFRFGNEALNKLTGTVNGNAVTISSTGPNGEALNGSLTSSGNSLRGTINASTGQIYDFVFTRR